MSILNFIRMLAVCSLLSVLLPQAAPALTRVVVTNTANCPANPVVNPCYVNISDAITDAVNGDAIEIRPGTYTGNFVLNKSVSLYGLETAATLLSGGGAGTVLAINNALSSVSIRNLTFANAATGVLVRGSSSVKINNNIFEVGTIGTAIQNIVSPNTIIENNTFYLNAVAIASDSASLNITNNLFYQNSGGLAISSIVDLTFIKNNLFFGGTIGPAVVTVTTMPTTSDSNSQRSDWKGNISDLDPLFVDSLQADITRRDFHLLSGTPCQDTGFPVGNDSVDATLTDIGAYGGPNADTIPLTVSILSATAPAADSVSLSWSANPAYTVKGYKVYYGHSSGNYSGSDALVSGATATSPIDAGTSTSLVLTGLTSTAAVPPAPVLNTPSPLNERLSLSWSPVAGATGYTVHYGIGSTAENTIDVGTATAVTLSGLTNGQTYLIAVSARAQATYYFAVTAYDANAGGRTAGVAHESAYSTETAVPVGTASESGPSNVVTGMPELIIANPALPNTGCFIATAAYGSPNDRAVQILRDFRDRHLATNEAGQAFVRWYYTYSPAAAAYLNEHSSLKPIVRGMLAPCVGTAYILNQAPEAALTAVMLASAVGIIMLIRRRQTVRSCTHPQERRP